jgi:hypothetical protein
VTAAAGAAACSCELGRARRHLERAIAELEQARLAWGAWADGVCKLAEQRTGISVAAGFGLLDDQEYARTLRLGAWFDDAASAAAVALEVAGAGDAALAPVCPCRGEMAIGSPHP